jgi:predicted metal-binding membrane protein
METQSAHSMTALARRDRVVILAEVAGLTALSWLYLVRMPMSASDFGEFAARLAAPIPAGIVQLWLVFMMWAVMMVAMMLPSAAPMILTYARLSAGAGGAFVTRAWIFAAGYFAIWTLFSLGATAAQAILNRVSILKTDDLTTSSVAGGIILAAAGVYQLTPLKNACLGHCQSPLAFFMTHWRDGSWGAFRMGLRHGAFCVGCCWLLMLVLFVVGVMNLAWVAALTAFVLIEKITPFPRAVARITGIALIGSGLFVGLRP